MRATRNAWVGRGLDARRGARAAEISPGFRASTVEPGCRCSCDSGTVHNTVLRTETVGELRRPPGWSSSAGFTATSLRGGGAGSGDKAVPNPGVLHSEMHAM